MKPSDKELGMNRLITRRDIVLGMSAIGAGIMLPWSLAACGKTAKSKLSSAPHADYPPALMGMRGNHDGAFDVAHALAREGRSDWGPVQQPDADIYDLVVVGGGISGLSAAHFYRKEKPDARILILDNHDDFGGHAKRNEFEANGKTLIMHGGSETMAAPSTYSDIVKGLLDDLGINLERFETAYDQEFYKRNGLKAGLHFSKDKWGVDRVVPLNMGFWNGFLSPAESDLTIEEAVSRLPISEAARDDFLTLLTTTEDQMPEIPLNKKAQYLFSISYHEFLSRHLGIKEPQVFDMLQDLVGEAGISSESISAYAAMAWCGLPGEVAAGLPKFDMWTEPYIHHFPDGNASIARLLVRAMIPDVAPGHTMEDVVTARFDYSKLDQSNSRVRLRLNSTVTQVAHEGKPQSSKFVNVSYVQNDQACQVKARNCVLACYNSIIPYLCPELPESQRKALENQVKQPILVTNVALRNWQAWKKMGICAVQAPGSYHTSVSLNYPVSLGEYTYAGGPDEPVMAYMMRFPHNNNPELTQQEQFRLGRHELLSTPFEDIERHVRLQLTSMLSEGGFDPATDILGITVNRWAHGYAYTYNSLYDDVYKDFNDERYPHVQARKTFGRIAIANSDAGAMAMMETAVEQGYRAVSELLV